VLRVLTRTRSRITAEKALVERGLVPEPPRFRWCRPILRQSRGLGHVLNARNERASPCQAMRESGVLRSHCEKPRPAAELRRSKFARRLYIAAYFVQARLAATSSVDGR
jgi:hypothetical protein